METNNNVTGVNFIKNSDETKKESSFVILNAGWDFKERRLQFQSIHSSFILAREAVKNYIDTPAMYNIVQLVEVTPDQGGTRSEEIWKLHNHSFYRDSVYINGLYNTDDKFFGKDVQRLLPDEQLEALSTFLERKMKEFDPNKGTRSFWIKLCLRWWFNELRENRLRY